MSSRKPPKQVIVSATRSPMNAKRWLLELGCGHPQWVTAARKPTARATRCIRCAEIIKAYK